MELELALVLKTSRKKPKSTWLSLKTSLPNQGIRKEFYESYFVQNGRAASVETQNEKSESRVRIAIDFIIFTYFGKGMDPSIPPPALG